MKPPIFIVASDGDLLAFDSPARAEGYVESIDVENGEYLHAFDSEGRLLALEVDRPTVHHKFLGLESVELTPVHLVEKEAHPSHSNELMTMLIEMLARDGQPVQRKDISMKDLVDRAFRIFKPAKWVVQIELRS